MYNNVRKHPFTVAYNTLFQCKILAIEYPLPAKADKIPFIGGKNALFGDQNSIIFRHKFVKQLPQTVSRTLAEVRPFQN